jgi:glycosyltransferase involved in cell wall biosynthesis
MNVLMIFNGHNVGGAELQFLELAQHMSRNHTVSVISIHGDQAVKHFELTSQIPLFSFPYQTSPYQRKVAAIGQLLKAANYGRRIKPDVIISTSFTGNSLAFLISKFLPARLLSLQTVAKAMAYPKLDRAILRRFDVLIAGCSDIKHYLVAHGQSEDSIKVVNNWVDFSSRVVSQSPSAIRERFGIAQDKTIIGCVGRMHEQKGQEFLIRAFRELAETRSDLKLLLVGDGPRMQEMRDEADGHPDIIFTGTAQGDDYNAFLNAIDIYVQPSRYEGLPRTLLDAMYMKRPVIATAVNGNLDAIQDKRNGLLVAPESSSGIYTALSLLLNDPGLSRSISEHAYFSAIENFSAGSQLDKIESALK